jgi:hypothetical protein
VVAELEVVCAASVLLDVCGDAGRERTGDEFLVRPAGVEDKREPRSAVADAGQKLQPADPRHLVVAEQTVDRVAAIETVQRRDRVCRRLDDDVVRLVFERVADEPAERRVVVDMEEADRVVCP